MYGTDYAYAETRLRDSVVMLDGEPIHVLSVDSSRVLGQRLADGAEVRTKLERLDVKPLKLGYVNFDNRTTYVMRMPKRRDWKQGTRPQNVTSLGDASIHDWPTHCWADTIKGIYPTFPEALRKVKAGVVSCAWHRHWCLSDDLSVQHKALTVGKVVNNTVVLDDNYRYLNESLREAL